jgi:hypothetical protein
MNDLLEKQTKQTMKTELMMITPSQAAAMLKDSNTNNRKLRQRWVEQLARDIKNGVFITTHQGIAFDDKQVLLDGQHRLAAIVLAGQPVEMNVTTGLESEICRRGVHIKTWDVIDKGGKRSDGEALKRAGFKHPQKVAGVVRVLLFFAGENSARSLSLPQIELALELVQSSVETCVAISEDRSNGLFRPRCAQVAAFVAYHSAYPAQAEELLCELVQITGEKKAPMRALARWAANHPQAAGSYQMSEFKVACAAIRCAHEKKPCEKLYATEANEEWMRKQCQSLVKKLKAIVSL